MRSRRLGLFLLVAAIGLTSSGCGGHGSEKYSGAPPTPEETYGQCVFCHRDVAAPMTALGGHGSLAVKCESCHNDLKPGLAECGHQSIPGCPECHTAQVTHHDPAVASLQQCTICHTPHGSPNLLLIRTEVPLSSPGNTVQACSSASECGADQTCASSDGSCGAPLQTGGCAAPIRFDNLKGRADGSFASATHPGTGLCEVCHTTTRFYRSDGTGAPHSEAACYACHPHELGFQPR